MRTLVAWLLAVLALAGSPALAAIPPRPEGPVLDQANIIPDAQEAALDQKLRAYNAATGRAIVVATIASLDGADVFDYTQELADSWGVGGKATDEGVIFLIAPQERKLRIHTGLGVQDRLTDALSGRIIRDTVTPRFKAGDFPGGIEAGVGEIITQLDRSPADAKAVAEAAAAARGAGGDDGVSVGSVIFWLVLIVFFIALFGRRGAQRGRRSGIDPGVVLWGLSEIAHHMADNRSRGGGGFDFGGGSGGGGFGGFGGGGFDGGGASGDW